MIYKLITVQNNLSYPSEIFYKDNRNLVEVAYKGRDFFLSKEDTFPFFALAKIRLELEKMDMFIMCNASRIDVYPSGMSAISLMAYELEMGLQAKKLVNIFDPIEDRSLLATVEEQKQFRSNWLKSLSKTTNT